MRRNPVKEIELLRQVKHEWKSPETQSLNVLLSDIKVDLLDVNLQLRSQDSGSFTLNIFGAGVDYDFFEQSLSFMLTSAPLPPEDNVIKLRALIDRTSIEIFANDGRMTMSFCYSPNPDAVPLSVEYSGATPQIEHLEVYELGSAWTNSNEP